MNEGTMWEAAIFAASEKLDNLVLIIDDNSSINRMINSFNLEKKLESFGFSVTDVDGHNVQELENAMLKKYKGPYAIVAKTKRGWGSETLMSDNSWFHRYPVGEELEKLYDEVDAF